MKDMITLRRRVNQETMRRMEKDRQDKVCPFLWDRDVACYREPFSGDIPTIKCDACSRTEF